MNEEIGEDGGLQGINVSRVLFTKISLASDCLRSGLPRLTDDEVNLPGEKLASASGGSGIPG